jgi:hypothetical protein
MFTQMVLSKFHNVNPGNVQKFVLKDCRRLIDMVLYNSQNSLQRQSIHAFGGTDT